MNANTPPIRKAKIHAAFIAPERVSFFRHRIVPQMKGRRIHATQNLLEYAHEILSMINYCYGLPINPVLIYLFYTI